MRRVDCKTCGVKNEKLAFLSANTKYTLRVFDAWRDQLHEKFATMVGKHWGGIAAYSQPTHTIPLGYVEGFNNKIRTTQRRAYGLRDEEYLELKILTLGLPEL